MRVRKLVAVPLLALVALDLARRVYRRTQIFKPAREPVRGWSPEAYGIPEDAVEEHWIETPDGESLYAWYCRAENPVASALFCHGNTGNLTISADIIPHLLAARMNVLFFDYRGFGKSSGRASYNGVIADAVTAACFHDTLRPRGLPSILYGFSLGGAIAAQLIQRHPFHALILQATFTNLTNIGRVLYPKIPLQWLFTGGLFDTINVIRNLRLPLLLLHGTHDETIPFGMGRELFAVCKSQKRMYVVDGGLHKDLYSRDPDTLVWAISQFLADLPHGKTGVIASAAR
jgi:pimeloyl-ACP methyl ester carboxylesterase